MLCHWLDSWNKRGVVHWNNWTDFDKLVVPAGVPTLCNCNYGKPLEISQSFVVVMLFRSFLTELKYKEKKVCVYVSVCICMCVCLYAHIHIYVCLYTWYTHISFQERIQNNLNCLQMLKITYSMDITLHDSIAFYKFLVWFDIRNKMASTRI